MLKFIDGGVCAAQGFRAAGVHAGVKTHAEWKKDVALIASDADCAAAAVFTRNVVKAAPTPAPPRGRKTRSACAPPRPRPWAAGRRTCW